MNHYSQSATNNLSKKRIRCPLPEIKLENSQEEPCLPTVYAHEGHKTKILLKQENYLLDPNEDPQDYSEDDEEDVEFGEDEEVKVVMPKKKKDTTVQIKHRRSRSADQAQYSSFRNRY